MRRTYGCAVQSGKLERRSLLKIPWAFRLCLNDPTCISGGTAMHTVSLTSLSALTEIPAAANCFSYARRSTSIKDVGAVPADPITNLRPLFPFPPQQTMPALY
jgi:hypothetical protein